jgi:hypothetical protein
VTIKQLNDMFKGFKRPRKFLNVVGKDGWRKFMRANTERGNVSFFETFLVGYPSKDDDEQGHYINDVDHL